MLGRGGPCWDAVTWRQKFHHLGGRLAKRRGALLRSTDTKQPLWKRPDAGVWLPKSLATLCPYPLYGELLSPLTGWRSEGEPYPDYCVVTLMTDSRGRS